MRRFFVEEMTEDSRAVDITGAELVHLKKVLRLAPGEKVAVFNGRGVELIGVVESVDRASARVALSGPASPAPESPVRITLLQGLVKGAKPELIVQKAVELGVSSMVFFPASRSVAGEGAPRRGLDNRLARLRRVAVEAAKQCGRAVVPEVSVLPGLDAALSQETSPAALKLVFMESGAAGGVNEAIARRRGRPGQVEAVLLVGPEGGLTADEARMAEERGFLPAALGPRVLRSETAAIAAIVAVELLIGDLGCARRWQPPGPEK